MDRLNELYGYKAKYENELEQAKKKVVYAEAYVKVVDDMIADEKAKCIVQPDFLEPSNEVNEPMQSDESY